MKSFMSPSIASQRVLLSVAAAGLMAGGLLLGKAAYSQSAQGSWATKSPIPAARNEVVAAVVNDKIYVLGGNFPRVQYDVAANEE
ncbi:MAG: hypothetical protein QOJ96_2120, partial [Alphaproteobacteria bacterium]|nr:hypothetical protein [Alphaproteobacteria bacterium]